jgi:hypothetical protein
MKTRPSGAPRGAEPESCPPEPPGVRLGFSRRSFLPTEKGPGDATRRVMAGDL